MTIEPPLSETQAALRGRAISGMTDAQVLDWIHACATMEQWAYTPAPTRREWKASRASAEAEILRRRKHGRASLAP